MVDHGPPSIFLEGRRDRPGEVEVDVHGESPRDRNQFPLTEDDQAGPHTELQFLFVALLETVLATFFRGLLPSKEFYSRGGVWDLLC